MRSNNTFLTLATSFCLSAVAYNVARPVEIPVQHLEFEPHVIQPRVETYEFDDYVIQPAGSIVDMDEVIITAQADEADDGDGANIDMMNENWCLIHPDDVICQDAGEEDEEEGC